MDPSPHRGAPSHPHHKLNDSANSSTDQNQHRVRFAEGEPQATYTIHQPTPRRERAAAAPSSSTAQPAVYWDERGPDRDIDRDSDANLAGYTFYREGTPTPPDYETPEKRLGHHGHGGGFGGPIAENSTIGGGTIGSERDFNLGHHNDNGNWGSNGSNGKSPSAKKRTLWISIAVGVLLLIGIAVGVGVGVSLNMAKGKAPAVEATGTASSSLPGSVLDPSPTPTSSPTTTPGGTGGAADTTSSSAAPRPTYNSDCPALNNTIYHVPGSTRRFLRVCGIDYSGTGATDVAEAYTESMADCMNSCASFDQCTACSWGYLQGDVGDRHRCYMKKDLKQSHVAAGDWCFAMLQK